MSEPEIVRAILERLARLEEKVDTLLEQTSNIAVTVARHDQWIAAREPVCVARAVDIQRLEQLVEDHEEYIQQQRGGVRAVVALAGLCGSLGTAGIAAILRHFGVI